MAESEQWHETWEFILNIQLKSGSFHSLEVFLLLKPDNRWTQTVDSGVTVLHFVDPPYTIQLYMMVIFRRQGWMRLYGCILIRDVLLNNFVTSTKAGKFISRSVSSANLDMRVLAFSEDMGHRSVINKHDIWDHNNHGTEDGAVNWEGRRSQREAEMFVCLAENVKLDITLSYWIYLTCGNLVV